MRAPDVLVAHHNQLRTLMRQLDGIPRHQSAERRRIMDVLMPELAMHEQIEDEIFYPAVRHISTLVPIAHAEHRQMSDQLAVVLRMDPGTERFEEEFRALRAAVEHHAAKEESEMFPEVARKLESAELEKIGDQLAARLDRLRASKLAQGRLRAKRKLIRRL